MENEKRLIDANALMAQLEERQAFLVKEWGYRDHYARGFEEAVDKVYDATTVDAVEIPDCKMCEFNYTLNWHQCEGCFGNARNNFTPRMDGGNEDV
jgi:hypothetical protein